MTVGVGLWKRGHDCGGGTMEEGGMTVGVGLWKRGA